MTLHAFLSLVKFHTFEIQKTSIWHASGYLLEPVLRKRKKKEGIFHCVFVVLHRAVSCRVIVTVVIVVLVVLHCVVVVIICCYLYPCREISPEFTKLHCSIPVSVQNQSRLIYCLLT